MISTARPLRVLRRGALRPARRLGAGSVFLCLLASLGLCPTPAWASTAEAPQKAMAEAPSGAVADVERVQAGVAGSTPSTAHETGGRNDWWRGVNWFEPATTDAQRPARRADQVEASEDSPFPVTGPLSGYMELHYNNVQSQDAVLDFHRFVLLFNHSFTERIRFVGELELEHALVEGLEEAGELELEQAYLDFLLTPALNVRAGMVLAPVGIINERHEPPAFHGVERPFVDTVIIPSTWFDAGVGLHGDLGRGFSYRAYLMAPLDATGLTAADGLRGGRQKGFQSNLRSVAGTGRLEYRGAPGFVLGMSGWRGKTGFATPRFDTRVSLGEVDGRFQRDRIALRGELVQVWVDGAGDLNDAVQRTVGVSPNIARQLRGFYLEGAYQLLPRHVLHELAAFVRYENFDTQFRMPVGYVPLARFDRTAWVLGVTYFPDPDVAVKFDYSIQHNRSRTIAAPDSLNVGLGWWF